MVTEEELKNRFREVHGDNYIYDNLDFTLMKNKVRIICPEHGEFWQLPGNHIKGQGCPMCGIESRAEKRRYDTATFKILFREKFGFKYDLSKVEYKDSVKKICVICPEHGEFWIQPNHLLDGTGCPECAKKKIGNALRYTTEDFIREAKKIHGDKYDYSKVEYINNHTKVCIICPIHGEFWQLPYRHLSGKGCPICGTLSGIEHSKTSLKRYYHPRKKLEEIITEKHLSRCGCPKCTDPSSKQGNEIADFVKSLVGKENVLSNDRTALKGKELDIYIPSLKFGIEYHGLYWHTFNRRKETDYHLNKLISCKEKGIKLVQIFEDEYFQHHDIVLSKIKHLLGKDKDIPKIYARKCSVKEINYTEAKKFLDKNHIQGGVTSSHYLGAFYEGNLIGVMSFKHNPHDKIEWELTRFATDNERVCIGVGGKLFSYFVRNFTPNSIKSFADRRWTVNDSDNLYTKLGFVLEEYTKPDYKYYSPHDGAIRQHKFGFRKDKLSKKHGLPITMTENEMTKQLGYERIYDCGLIKYVWRKS